MKQLKKYTLLLLFNLAVICAFSQSKPYDTTGYEELTGTKDISGNAKYIIPSGKSWSGGISVGNNQKLSLIIEGSATVSWVDLKKSSNLEVIIGTTGSVNFDTFQDESSYTLINYSSTLTISRVGGTVINHGTVTGNPNIHVNTDAVLENYGTMNTVDLTTDNQIKNYGTMNVSGQLSVYETGTLENSCKIIVKGNFINGNDPKKGGNGLIMKESAYLEIQGRTSFYDKSSMTFEQDAFLKTKDIWTYGHTVTGPATGYALIQYFGTLTGTMPKFFEKKIYFVDSKGYQDGAPISYSIAASDCNPGFGAVSDDPDGDGIPNNLDEFPNDPSRAFIAYYPADPGTWNTYFFEDLWPNLGDYDFNDLVIKYQYEYYLNAENEVVDLVAHFQVRAAGASYANGFGFKLDIPNASVLNVTGYVHSDTSIALNANKTEKGSSDEAVIIVYNNLRASLGSMFNVRHDQPEVVITPIAVRVYLDKVKQSDVSTVNPFIFVDQDRGREVHLMGYAPTSKANPDYFGKEDDDSNSGVYYRSKQRYPWGLDVPSDVRHLLEKIDFTTGYPDFVKWAESGGTLHQDWYRTNLYTPALY
ncbi:MAG: LruC domain-containing protein [Mangrovibacterium sp.]|nr:LruC domain-containing protein [Mangrovibacterium sp.]